MTSLIHQNSFSKILICEQSFHQAALNDNIEVGEFLLDRGINIHTVVDSNGNTLLHDTCYHNCCKFTTFLLEHDAKINAKCKTNDTPLHYAVDSSHLEIIKLLIKYKADLNCKGENGFCAIHNASASIKPKALTIVKLLLEV